MRAGYLDAVDVGNQVLVEVAELEPVIRKPDLDTLLGDPQRRHRTQRISLHHNSNMVNRPLLVYFGQVDADAAFAQRQGRRQATDPTTHHQYFFHDFSPMRRAALPPRMAPRSASLNPGTSLTRPCTP